MGSIDYTNTAHCSLIKEAYSEYTDLWQKDPFGFSGALYLLEIYFDVLGGGPRSLDALHSWSRRTIVCGKDVLLHSLVEYFEMLITLNPDTISTAMGISSTSNLHVWGLLWRQMALDSRGNLSPVTDWKFVKLHSAVSWFEGMNFPHADGVTQANYRVAFPQLFALTFNKHSYVQLMPAWHSLLNISFEDLQVNLEECRRLTRSQLLGGLGTIRFEVKRSHYCPEILAQSTPAALANLGFECPPIRGYIPSMPSCSSPDPLVCALYYRTDQGRLVHAQLESGAVWRSDRLQPVDVEIRSTVNPDKLSFAQWLCRYSFYDVTTAAMAQCLNLFVWVMGHFGLMDVFEPSSLTEPSLYPNHLAFRFPFRKGVMHKAHPHWFDPDSPEGHPFVNPHGWVRFHGTSGFLVKNIIRLGYFIRMERTKNNRRGVFSGSLEGSFGFAPLQCLFDTPVALQFSFELKVFKHYSAQTMGCVSREPWVEGTALIVRSEPCHTPLRTLNNKPTGKGGYFADSQRPAVYSVPPLVKRPFLNYRFFHTDEKIPEGFFAPELPPIALVPGASTEQALQQVASTAAAAVTRGFEHAESITAAATPRRQSPGASTRPRVPIAGAQYALGVHAHPPASPPGHGGGEVDTTTQVKASAVVTPRIDTPENRALDGQETQYRSWTRAGRSSGSRQDRVEAVQSKQAANPPPAKALVKHGSQMLLVKEPPAPPSGSPGGPPPVKAAPNPSTSHANAATQARMYPHPYCTHPPLPPLPPPAAARSIPAAPPSTPQAVHAPREMGGYNDPAPAPPAQPPRDVETRDIRPENVPQWVRRLPPYKAPPAERPPRYKPPPEELPPRSPAKPKAPPLPAALRANPQGGDPPVRPSLVPPTAPGGAPVMLDEPVPEPPTRPSSRNSSPPPEPPWNLPKASGIVRLRVNEYEARATTVSSPPVAKADAVGTVVPSPPVPCPTVQVPAFKNKNKIIIVV